MDYIKQEYKEQRDFLALESYIQDKIYNLSYIDLDNIIKTLEQYRDYMDYNSVFYTLLDIIYIINKYIDDMNYKENYYLFYDKLKDFLINLECNIPVDHVIKQDFIDYIIHYLVFYKHTSLAIKLLQSDKFISNYKHINSTQKHYTYAQITPLSLAIYYDYPDLIKLLIINKADINHQDEKTGLTDLHRLIIGSFYPYRLELFLQNKYIQYDPYIEDKNKITVIDYLEDLNDGLRKILQKYIDEDYNSLDIKNALD